MSNSTVITDASFCPEKGYGGWAAWIRVSGNPKPIKHFGQIRQICATSTEAEMLAAINGIWIAKQYGASRALLQTDCITVVELIKGKTRKRHLISSWNCAIEKAGLIGFPIEGRHVKGHTRKKDARSYVNRWCDENAKREMRALRDSQKKSDLISAKL